MKILLLPFVVLSGFLCAASANAMPNVVLISADDLGEVEITRDATPNLYQLSREGLRFTRFYSYPVCSPSRAALMTGRNPMDFGFTGLTEKHGRPLKRPLARVRPPKPADRLPRGIATLGKLMRSKGYRTGYFGKWHLGKYDGGMQALGYDTAVTTQGYSHILTHIEMDPKIDVPEGTRRDQYITEKALEFIGGEQPFYVEIHNFLPHLPLEVKGDLAPPDAAPGKLHEAHLAELDELIGKVLDRLEGTDTLVLFLSDNGALENWQGLDLMSNAPLRGEKGTVYEGGVRIPFIAWWPGKIEPLSTSRLGFLSDVYAMLSTLEDGELHMPERDEIVIHFPHYHKGRPASALITDRWKIVRDYETGTDEMFDLQNDVGEQNPLPARPALSARLTEALADTSLPVANPDYDAGLEMCEADCEQLQAERLKRRIGYTAFIALLLLLLLRWSLRHRRKRTDKDPAG